jgi:hypothetical protein
MAEHLVKLWIRSDDTPSGIDWQAWLPKGITVEQAEVATFPWAGVEHVITWWITRPLNAEEWGELDEGESELLARIVGDGNFQGMAGPIPSALEKQPDSEPRQSEARVGDGDARDELYLRLRREHDHLRRVQKLILRIEGEDGQALRWLLDEYLRMAATLLDQ